MIRTLARGEVGAATGTYVEYAGILRTRVIIDLGHPRRRRADSRADAGPAAQAKPTRKTTGWRAAKAALFG